MTRHSNGQGQTTGSIVTPRRSRVYQTASHCVTAFRTTSLSHLYQVVLKLTSHRGNLCRIQLPVNAVPSITSRSHRSPSGTQVIAQLTSTPAPTLIHRLIWASLYYTVSAVDLRSLHPLPFSKSLPPSPESSSLSLCPQKTTRLLITIGHTRS